MSRGVSKTWGTREHPKLWGGRAKPRAALSAHPHSEGAEPARSRQHPTTLHAPLTMAWEVLLGPLPLTMASVRGVMGADDQTWAEGDTKSPGNIPS